MTPPEFARRLDDALLEALTPLCGDLAFRGVDKIRSVLLTNGDVESLDRRTRMLYRSESLDRDRVLVIPLERDWPMPAMAPTTPPDDEALEVPNE